MKDKLLKYGKVEQCEEKDGMFHVLITDGFDGNAMKTFEIMDLIRVETEGRFMLVHKADTGEGKFHLILKPNFS